MLSKRLSAVAEMVTKGNIVADIGTDHGYVPIYLVKNNICPLAYAMDINEGPIKNASMNVEAEGLSDKIKCIRSDGMEKLKPNMADSVIIAGMGGELIVKILENSIVNDTISELVLAPHRDIDLVRKYVMNNNWHIVMEKMLIDAGKFYTVIKVKQGREKMPYNILEYTYGRLLLKNKDEILKLYLQNEYEKFKKIHMVMKQNNSKDIENVEGILALNRRGREMYD